MSLHCSIIIILLKRQSLHLLYIDMVVFWITAYAYVLLYILINNLAVKKKIEIIQIIYLGIYAFDQMLSGGRTALFRMITAILIITVICFWT